MHISPESALLGGLSSQAFMRRHWQKKPLLIRAACRGVATVVTRQQLFELASREEVESRLVVHDDKQRWRLRHGPFGRRALPSLTQRQWTLLVQGVDLHVDAACELMQRFRFVPDARLDDLMVSYATDGGGVGPHFDSYDVFLLQLQGRRRWRIGRLRDTELEPDVPLRILTNFVAEHEWLLEPGDMLYLPPRWAHDGIAQGESMTGSIGFRAERRQALASALLQRLLDEEQLPAEDRLYRDPSQAATATPAQIPAPLQAFAAQAIAAKLADPRQLACALGEILSEVKPQVVFDAPTGAQADTGMRLDRRTRMLYDRWHVFVNGESFRASGRD
ncbi:MAG: cupin domain-containing protein, partial [Rhizobacter sp.]|nr:cupin domain-containing protein [Rhizobacter sp.]